MGMTIGLDYRYTPRPRYRRGSPHPRIERLLAANKDNYGSLLDEFTGYLEHLRRIPLEPDQAAPGEPCWNNGWLPSLDALSVYCLLARRNPSVYFEVGSGNSTKFARRAIRDHGLRTRIISVDPEPRAEVDALCDEVVRQPFEDVDPAVYADLAPDAVVFVDNSHRCFQNSDVMAVFLELLPSLPVGVVAGLHDIFLPYDYPQDWAGRWYNEQYMLAAYLLGGGGGYRPLLPNRYASRDPALMARLDPFFAAPELAGLGPMGVAFWMERASAG